MTSSKTNPEAKPKRLKKLVQPQEIIVWYVLPGIRRVLTNTLINDYNMPQTQIAKRFGLTEPAISQYKDKVGKKNIRGKKVEFEPAVMDYILEAARRIAEEDSYAPREVQRILKFIEKGKYLCQFHRQYGLVHQKCQICTEDDN